MEKLSPMITIDYEKYKELIYKIDDLQDLLRHIYDITKDGEIKEEIESHMIKNRYWI